MCCQPPLAPAVVAVSSPAISAGGGSTSSPIASARGSMCRQPLLASAVDRCVVIRHPLAPAVVDVDAPRDRGRPFSRRQTLYEALDHELATYTRFFAAAALTNSVFAQLFTSLPRGSLLHAYQFLSDAGLELETANLHYAHEISRTKNLSGPGLDLYLVRREQRLMQKLLNERGVRTDAASTRLTRELDSLLNRQVVAVISRVFACSRQYSRVLRAIRRELGLALTFADESHRVLIGLGIIRHIRHRS